MSTAQLAVLIAFSALSVDVVRRLLQDRIERKGYPLPPGPTPIPFFGNVFSMNTQEPFKTYTEWREKYGDIMYLRLLDMDVVVLNSPSIATDMLDKRSNIYSDRPYIATVNPYGHDVNFSLSRYGDQWRLCRRIFHQTFRAEAVVNFRPVQLRDAHQLVINVMDDPNDFTAHYSTFAAGVAMSTVYDYNPKPFGDPLVSIINKFIEASTSALFPERAILVKTLPFLLHIPDVLPGSSMKHEARIARELSFRMVEEPYQHVQRRMESNEDMGISMVSDHIIRMEKFDDKYRSQYELALKRASATAFLGSVETTSSTLIAFTLAMVKNPRVWKRAQKDIDNVTGMDRLPKFDDRPSLPYIDAIMRETLRWQPTTPIVPHAAITSDIYNGFYIPKGAAVLANVWGMSRDETRYPNAELFIPERFLDAEGNLTDDMPNFVFGFGRRVCPGRHTADASVWIALATMLATFDFNPAKDTDGKDVDFEPEFLNGLTRHPLPFPCAITPRPHIKKEFIEMVSR